MALAYAHIMFLMELEIAGHFRHGVKSMLEFGEQNWFGDVAASELPKVAGYCKRHQAEIDDVARQVSLLYNPDGTRAHQEAGFDAAKLFYRVIFGVTDYQAIDLHGTPKAMPLDLNQPVSLDRQFDITTNLGTAEHIFNQAQFFKSMHDLTKPGGLMLHSLPNQGCYDHGFYNYHPTFVFDLCSANQYDVLALCYVNSRERPAQLIGIPTRQAYVELAVQQRLSDYSGLIALLRRTTDAPFASPRQSYYNSALPPDLAAAWAAMER